MWLLRRLLGLFIPPWLFGRRCVNCGRFFRGDYARCYRCSQAAKRAGWHDPERLPEVLQRDAQRRRAKFYVYLLETEYGHYVGHSGNLRRRLYEHSQDKVPSTAGGRPQLIWQSAPFATREEATRFEAALKSLRDNRRAKFTQITRHKPVPYRRRRRGWLAF